MAGFKRITYSLHVSAKTRFDIEKVDELVDKAKAVMCASGADVQKSLVEFFGKYGIEFSVVKNFRVAPVHGYIKKG